MENEKSLFDLNVDMMGKAHLKEAAKWGKFLAIVGMIGIVVLIAFSILVAVIGPSSETGDGTEVDKTAAIVAAITVSLIVGALYFFPCLFLLRFSTRLTIAIDTNDVTNLNESFRNLKITLRYLGVVTIIFLVLLVLGLFSGF